MEDRRCADTWPAGRSHGSALLDGDTAGVGLWLAPPDTELEHIGGLYSAASSLCYIAGHREIGPWLRNGCGRPGQFDGPVSPRPRIHGRCACGHVPRAGAEVGSVATAATVIILQDAESPGARVAAGNTRAWISCDTSASGLHRLRLPFPPRRLQIEISPEVSGRCLMAPSYTAICHGCRERPTYAATVASKFAIRNPPRSVSPNTRWVGQCFEE